MADDRLFQVQIITPDRVFYSGEAVMLELTTTEGEIGIYKHHVPMTYLLSPGVVTITEPEGKRTAALHTGFIRILQEEVTILAEMAEWPEEIDMNRAEEARQRAERRLQMADPNINVARAEMSLHKALTRLEAGRGRKLSE